MPTILLELAHDVGTQGGHFLGRIGHGFDGPQDAADAITLDLGLSDIDGFVLLDLLRHDPDTADIPVYVISGAEQAAHALTIGAAGVIEKPAANDRLTDLFGKIRNETPAKPRRKKAPANRGGPARLGRSPSLPAAGS